FARSCQLMLRRTCAGETVPILGLKLRGELHTTPFGFIQLAVAVAVEALQKTGIFRLPLADHLLPGIGQIQPLAAATQRPEITYRIQRLAGMQSLFAVTVLA